MKSSSFFATVLGHFCFAAVPLWFHRQLPNEIRQVSKSDSARLCKRQASLPSALLLGAVSVLLCTSLTLPSVALAQQGTFVPTGSLNTGRSSHTATLLNNGKVLVAGGTDSSNAHLASAELYDPATETFTLTGSMNTTRSSQQATLLANGKVLVAGGDSSGGVTAELYDPTTETFTPTGSMNTAHALFTATLLNNGKVLVAGGQIVNPVQLASAELYDPATGIFTPTGSMNTGRWGHTATLLNNGKVLVAGGYSPGENTAELYDPATGTFTPTGSMNQGRLNGAATLLKNGMVLVVGGGSVSAELYNPATGTFTFTGSMSYSRSLFTATLLNNGMVLVVGVAPPELYDPATGTFTLVAGSLSTVIELHTATLLNTGMVLVAGGLDMHSVPSASAELYELVVVSPPSLSFSNQPTGTTSAPQTVTLTNNESAALTVATVSINGLNASDFAETDNCVGTLSAGASCSINVTHTVALTGTGQDFSMMSPAPMASVAAGQTATYSVSVSPGGGFNQTVSFSCAGAPSLSICMVSPSSAILNGTSATPLMITVSTTATRIVFPDYPKRGPRDPGNYELLVLVLALSALALMVSLVKRTHTRHSLATVSLLALTICIGFALAACGGGGSSKPGTPAGTYSLTVTGTFNSGATTLAHNAQLKLVVQ